MVGAWPTALCRGREVRKVGSTVAPPGGEVECGVSIVIDQQCTLQAVVRPDNRETRRPVTIRDVRYVVDEYGIEDHVNRMRPSR